MEPIVLYWKIRWVLGSVWLNFNERWSPCIWKRKYGHPETVKVKKKFRNLQAVKLQGQEDKSQIFLWTDLNMCQFVDSELNQKSQLNKFKEKIVWKLKFPLALAKLSLFGKSRFYCEEWNQKFLHGTLFYKLESNKWKLRRKIEALNYAETWAWLPIKALKICTPQKFRTVKVSMQPTESFSLDENVFNRNNWLRVSWLFLDWEIGKNGSS